MAAAKLLPATAPGANSSSLVCAGVQGDIGHEGQWMVGRRVEGLGEAKLGYCVLRRAPDAVCSLYDPDASPEGTFTANIVTPGATRDSSWSAAFTPVGWSTVAQTSAEPPQQLPTSPPADRRRLRGYHTATATATVTATATASLCRLSFLRSVAELGCSSTFDDSHDSRCMPAYALCHSLVTTPLARNSPREDTPIHQRHASLVVPAVCGTCMTPRSSSSSSSSASVTSSAVSPRPPQTMSATGHPSVF
ncbi:hypothetical protein EKO04_004165 [Ascochyta lentis]|uniref:Uncharacterized protein n=1 Tax=Ascochyta lentis TaxID=205686 RepID=A0A8H7J783_9PLEO|nr:hypothetical protein EKO04_004165 [Ascochyta lentis]